MANTKNPKPSTEDAMAAVSALIARAKRDGSIQATELTAELEKLDLPVEKIEHIYDTFDAMGIQIVSPELELDVSDDLSMDMDEVEQHAVDDLGMVKMDNSQIEYVELTRPDVVTVSGSGHSLSSAISGLTEWFSSVVEYIR